jgi:EmrB/QacA subfamily drug resistance transporter
VSNNQEVSKMSALLVACIASFLTPFMGSSINIALPAIANEFAANAILISWIPTSFLLTAAMFAIPFGRIADVYGMKKVFIYGIIIFTIATILAFLSPSVEFLIISRVLQGIGSAMIFVTGLAILTSVFPPRERGKAIGISITSVYLGLFLGPVLGGILTQYLGWRSIFYLIIPLGFLVIFIIFFTFKGVEWAECKGESFDLYGSIFYSISLLLVLTGFSIFTSSLGKIMLISGIIGFIIFIIQELRIKHPVLDMKLFLKNRMFAFSNLAALISFSGTYAVVFLLSLYLQYIKGFDPRTTGLILATLTVFMALLSPVSGRLSDSFEARKLASLGMILTTIGLFFFIFLNADTSLYYIAMGLAVLGIGSGIFSSPNTNAVMGSVERRFFGVASATISTMRIIGQTLSMGMVLLIFAVYIGAVQFTPQNYPALLSSIKISFIIATTLCFGAIFASLAR